MKKGLLLAVILIFGISCQQEEMYQPSSFPELNGKYEYQNYNSWENGLYEDYRYQSWEFDKTREVFNYWKYWSYTSNGWTNALKKSGGNSWEWKIENGTFYKRYWNTTGAKWSSYSFEYINNNSFKLDGVLYTKIK